MTPHPTSHRARSALVAACVALGVLAAPLSASAEPSSAACNARANDTAKKLIPCIKTADLWNHMKAFQAIADANPGLDGHPSRNSGEPGYLASVNYVKQKMDAAGYTSHIQTYKFDYSSFVGTPTWSETSPTAHDFKLVDEWSPGKSNGSADADVQPAGGIVMPPDPNGSTSTSGCTSGDFDASMAGRIALIQRGGCNFGVKVLNAQAAHAAGVIIFNEGNPGRTEVTSGSMVDADGNPFVASIPVAFTSFAIGKQLYDDAQAGRTPHMTLSVATVDDPNRDDYNLISESKWGDPNHVIVIDAHLDAIYGAGMLDNASGSATILNLAEQLKKAHPRNKLRFIWFGGEELGLLGSDYYVNHLSSSELSKISYDLDADVTATPNYLIGVLDPAGPQLFDRSTTDADTFPSNVYGPSKIARDYGVDYLNSIGKNHEFLSPSGTDAYEFNLAGVPASGVLTGQDCCKLPEEVNLFGGQLGNYEGNLGTSDGGCVDNPFRWCDNLSNNDPAVMTFISRTFANMAIRMAYATDFSGPSQARMARARAAKRARTKAARRGRPALARGAVLR